VRIADGAADTPGELRVRGAPVFTCYWGKPEATAETFGEAGWFKTGDLVSRDGDGYMHILGRLSADIIKSGGFKISALEIERVLLEHAEIGEVAVFGVPDDTYGERVAAVLVLKPGAGGAGSLAAAATSGGGAAMAKALKAWAGTRLAHQKVPSVVVIVEGTLKRNAMGKINKKELRKEVLGSLVHT